MAGSTKKSNHRKAEILQSLVNAVTKIDSEDYSFSDAKANRHEGQTSSLRPQYSCTVGVHQCTRVWYRHFLSLIVYYHLFGSYACCYTNNGSHIYLFPKIIWCVQFRTSPTGTPRVWRWLFLFGYTCVVCDIPWGRDVSL